MFLLESGIMKHLGKNARNVGARLFVFLTAICNRIAAIPGFLRMLRLSEVTETQAEEWVYRGNRIIGAYIALVTITGFGFIVAKLFAWQWGMVFVGLVATLGACTPGFLAWCGLRLFQTVVSNTQELKQIRYRMDMLEAASEMRDAEFEQLAADQKHQMELRDARADLSEIISAILPDAQYPRIAKDSGEPFTEESLEPEDVSGSKFQTPAPIHEAEADRLEMIGFPAQNLELDADIREELRAVLTSAGKTEGHSKPNVLDEESPREEREQAVAEEKTPVESFRKPLEFRLADVLEDKLRENGPVSPVSDVPSTEQRALDVEEKFVAALDAGDLSACQWLWLEMLQVSSPEQIIALQNRYDGLIEAKALGMRAEFAALVRAQNFKAAMDKGDEIVELFPESRMASDYQRIRPQLQRRLHEASARQAKAL